MPYSLEELLAKEGFKGKRLLSKSRLSIGSNATKKPINQSPHGLIIESAPGNQTRRETRSIPSQCSSSGELSVSDGFKGKIQKDDMNNRGKKDRSNREYMRRREGKRPTSGLEGKKFDGIKSNSEEEKIFKDIHSNEVHIEEGEKGKHSHIRTKEGSMEGPVNSVNAESLKKHLLGRKSLDHNDRKNMKIPAKFRDKSDKSSQDSKNHDSFVHSVSTPVIGEAAIQAIVSILNGHIRCFLKDIDFRTLLWKNCFSSLNSVAIERHNETKVIENLEQAVAIVDKYVEGYASERDLKRASLQLSMISGLNANISKDGFTAGVPNSELSACAHLYLSVIYSLQKKDKASAKHILQVFCDSSFQARTKLLPELWDCVFLPHLSHLKVWYENEADSMGDSPGQKKKLEFLKKAYDEILDSGTHKFAIYYKYWLTEGVDNPSLPAIPSIDIPSISFLEINEVSSNLDESFSPQPMVCKKLYDAVFGNPRKMVVDENLKNFDNCLKSSYGSSPLQHSETYKSDNVNHADVAQLIREDFFKSSSDDASPEIGVLLRDIWKIHDVNLPPEEDVDNELNNSITWQKNIGETEIPNVQKIANFSDSMISTTSETLQDIKLRPFAEGNIIGRVYDLNIHNDSLEEISLLLSIPMEFTCPLTEKLFENPVTLETGQTFEQQAIKEWFNQGNKTCPVTGRSLETLLVPPPNFVLKRVIDKWKFHHCTDLLALAAQIVDESREDRIKDKDDIGILVFEQILTGFGKEEGRKNIEALISMGGLKFFFQRLEVGSLEEMTRVLSLLLFCVEAYPGCRNQIAQEINKGCLLKLLHSKNVNSISNVVQLLTKLICFNRRRDATILLHGLLNEGMEDVMDVLLHYLRSARPLEKPLVAVLLLHIDLTVEFEQHSIYRNEAVDALTTTLYDSLTDESIQERCCQAMMILGGRFSFSGKLLIENWMLKQARYVDSRIVNLSSNQDEGLILDDTIISDEEERGSEKWLRILTKSLLDSGEKSFLEAISKCLGAGNSDLVEVCLITLCWLSFSLSSLCVSELQLSAFSVLISHLKNNLENGLKLEHKTLAATTLLNFSKISEHRALVKSIRKEISAPLTSMAEVSWPATAKQLYAIISSEEEEDSDSFSQRISRNRYPI